MLLDRHACLAAMGVKCFPLAVASGVLRFFHKGVLVEALLLYSGASPCIVLVHEELPVSYSRVCEDFIACRVRGCVSAVGEAECLVGVPLGGAGAISAPVGSLIPTARTRCLDFSSLS